ncbi:MAG: ribosome biogenesis GTPase Der, partial [Acidimicrobiales bacterium]
VAGQALAAVGAADVVLFVVDAGEGITAGDVALAESLRRGEAPVLVVANKVDAAAAEPQAAELWGLGLGEPIPVSALHGRGSGDLLDRIVELLPETLAPAPASQVASIAIVGRPNVGKSSLFNRLVGEERAIVLPEPGTTRDSVDSLVELGGRLYRFVDTAGMRRRAKTSGVEVFAAARTRAAVEAADVAVLMVDAAEGATSQDQRLAQEIAGAGAGAILALNKWDLVAGDRQAKLVAASVSERLHFISYAPVLRTSALTGRGVGKIAPSIEAVLQARALRVPTGRLNRLIREVQDQNPPPRTEGGRVRVLYATQTGAAPPSFVAFATGRIAAPWLRFLERRLREEFGFAGNPIRLLVRERGADGGRGGGSR